MQSLKSRIYLGGVFWICFAAFCGPIYSDSANPPFDRREKVPPFPRDLTWLNTAGPLELKDLHGKFVLVDFWTYCCINCMHILPELKKLERAYPNELVVVGVHSAKFEAEQDPKNIADAIRRYKIEHPVVNDANHVLWDRFGVNAWPTVILIDPEGYAVWGTSGEITFDQVDKVLKSALPYYRRKKLIDATPLSFDFERRKAEATPLEFPGKILADEKSGRLFIADSSHNRIVIARLDGALIDILGSGAAGLVDGNFVKAEFNQPQGMALHGDSLYVADTENHAIRKADLKSRTVTTFAGTGKQNREPPAPGRRADPRKIPFSSPWDLAIRENDLFIAMAGSHQIWKMKLDGSAIAPYAGNGREDIVDGPLLPRQAYQLGFASFAQPSGLAANTSWLYVADSEGSSIRAAPFDPRQEVRTVVGTSQLPNARLFTFGDVDGNADRARFQHPLGVAYHEGKIYVADTYNNKIRVVDPTSGVTSTLAGTGRAGSEDDPASFDEPAGISAAAGKLFIADTNNHLIRTIDLKTKKVSSLPLNDLKPPQPTAKKNRSLSGAIEEKIEKAIVRPENGTVRLSVEIELPAGFKINPLAPMAYRLEEIPETEKPTSDENAPSQILINREKFNKTQTIEKPAANVEIRLPLDKPEGRDRFRLIVDYYYCREGSEGVCKTATVYWSIPLQLLPTAENNILPLRHQQ
jgi:thiol-disulfide isomerase/thioredoxin